MCWLVSRYWRPKRCSCSTHSAYSRVDHHFALLLNLGSGLGLDVCEKASRTWRYRGGSTAEMTKSWPTEEAPTFLVFCQERAFSFSANYCPFQNMSFWWFYFIFIFFWESGFILLSFSLRGSQVWMNRDTLLGCLIFLSPERKERNKANWEASGG